MVNANAVVVGPSHVLRIKDLVERGALGSLLDPSNLIGKGGAPVWSKQLLDLALAPKHRDKPIFMLVSDFRFGNTAFDAGGLPAELFADGHIAVSLKALTPENDALLMARSLKALEVWHEAFGSRLRFIFWDLLCRQVQDRLAGKHISDGRYNHPHWNLVEIQNKVPSDNLIDLSILLNQPMHQLMCLFIDGSNHASHAGYIFLHNIIVYDLPVIDAFSNGIFVAESYLQNAAVNLIQRYGGGPVVLTGKSVWIDTLMRYLGPTGLGEFDKLGFKVAPTTRQIGHPFHPPVFDSADTCIAINACKSSESSRATRNLIWEPRCVRAIAARQEEPKFTYDSDDADENTSPVDISWIEIGPLGIPTLRGLVGLLDEM